MCVQGGLNAKVCLEAHSIHKSRCVDAAPTPLDLGSRPSQPGISFRALAQHDVTPHPLKHDSTLVTCVENNPKVCARLCKGAETTRAF